MFETVEDRDDKAFEGIKEKLPVPFLLVPEGVGMTGVVDVVVDVLVVVDVGVDGTGTTIIVGTNVFVPCGGCEGVFKLDDGFPESVGVTNVNVWGLRVGTSKAGVGDIDPERELVEGISNKEGPPSPPPWITAFGTADDGWITLEGLLELFVGTEEDIPTLNPFCTVLLVLLGPRVG